MTSSSGWWAFHPKIPNSPLYKIWAQREADQAVHLIGSRWRSSPGAANFLDFSAEHVPPPFMESVTFDAGDGRTCPPTDVGRWVLPSRT